ncbi:MAG: amidohydrolase family protein [Clostridia bacterium]|nr:amidohydrolase family protein [Clostridia bacterium]
MNVLIKNCKIVDDISVLRINSDILIENGVIRDIAVSSKKAFSAVKADKTVDMSGCCVCPAFVDIGADLCDPGFTSREDISSGTRAATEGGYSKIYISPKTEPQIDNAEAVRNIRTAAKNRAFCDVEPMASAFQNGKTNDIRSLFECGVRAVFDACDKNVSQSEVLFAMTECAKYGILFVSCCQSPDFSGEINRGRMTKILNLDGIPSCAETITAFEKISLAKAAGCRLLLCDISCGETAEIIREAKKTSNNIFASTSAEYFALSEDDVLFYGANAKLLPPLRTKNDIERIIAAIKDGTVDCIFSSHSPKTQYEKNDLKSALFGSIGLETTFAAANTYLCDKGHISLPMLIKLLSKNPADILGISKDGYGKIETGKEARICAFDPGGNMLVGRTSIKSKSFNTPFMGMNLSGKIKALVLGEQIYTF